MNARPRRAAPAPPGQPSAMIPARWRGRRGDGAARATGRAIQAGRVIQAGRAAPVA